jgi:H+/Cl- antiporter ClcA
VFLPPLLLGAVLGRLVAGGLQWATDTVGWDHTFHYGAYAVIGAASMLAGVVRMTLSLTVVVIETTSNVSFGLPIMICLVVCLRRATKVTAAASTDTTDELTRVRPVKNISSTSMRT